jgi:hypothetical protein
VFPRPVKGCQQLEAQGSDRQDPAPLVLGNNAHESTRLATSLKPGTLSLEQITVRLREADAALGLVALLREDLAGEVERRRLSNNRRPCRCYGGDPRRGPIRGDDVPLGGGSDEPGHSRPSALGEMRSTSIGFGGDLCRLKGQAMRTAQATPASQRDRLTPTRRPT